MTALYNHSPRAILFDLDGTLAHTAPDLVGATNYVCSMLGHAPVDYDILAPHASAGTAALLKTALGITQQHPNFENLKTSFLKRYEETIADKTQLFSGIAELLSELDSHDIVWGIVTNKPSKYTNLLVPKIGLADAACVVSGDTTAYSKPHPEPLFEAVRRISLKPSDCWYVGDDVRDVKAAHAAGMLAIAVGWGYGEHINDWGADFVVDSPTELLGLLKHVQQSSKQNTAYCETAGLSL